MKNDCLPISPNQFRAHAEKAVQCYLHEQFPKYFSAEEKEDLVSEVVLRMWRSMGSFDPARGALSTWVGTIARNVVRSAALAKWNRTDISHRLEEQELSVDESCLGLYRSGEFSADGELLVLARGERLMQTLGVPTMGASDVSEVGGKEIPKARPPISSVTVALFPPCMNDAKFPSPQKSIERRTSTSGTPSIVIVV